MVSKALWTPNPWLLDECIERKCNILSDAIDREWMPTRSCRACEAEQDCTAVQRHRGYSDQEAKDEIARICANSCVISSCLVAVFRSISADIINKSLTSLPLICKSFVKPMFTCRCFCKCSASCYSQSRQAESSTLVGGVSGGR